MKGDFSSMTKKKKKPTPEQIEAFANKAKVDGEVTQKVEQEVDEKKLDPKGNLDFTAMKLSLNEYLNDVLNRSAEEMGMKPQAYIRYLIVKESKKIL